MSSFKPTKVTERVFAQIKDDLAADHTEPWIREVYGVGLTTMRLIKKCKNYDAYKRAHAERLAKRKCKQPCDKCKHTRQDQINEIVAKLLRGHQDTIEQIEQTQKCMISLLSSQSRAVTLKENETNFLKAMIYSCAFTLLIVIIYLICQVYFIK